MAQIERFARHPFFRWFLAVMRLFLQGEKWLLALCSAIARHFRDFELENVYINTRFKRRASANNFRVGDTTGTQLVCA